MNYPEYSERVVMVTGAAKGFGAMFARRFAACGARVALTDVADGQSICEEIKKTGAEALFIPLDVTQDDQWAKAVDQTVAHFGGLDLVINNAGIEISELIIESDPKAALQLLNINVIGTMLGMKHAFRVMQPSGSAGRGGVVLNLASVAGLSTTPGVAVYSASKASVIKLTQLAAVEAGALGYNVRVNCLCPGLMKTDLGVKLLQDFVDIGLAESTQEMSDSLTEGTPLGRLGVPDEVGSAALFLCSDQAGFLTGVALPVDGGFSA